MFFLLFAKELGLHEHMKTKTWYSQKISFDEESYIQELSLVLLQAIWSAEVSSTFPINKKWKEDELKPPGGTVQGVQ